jgi:hypothetical protein
VWFPVRLDGPIPTQAGRGEGIRGSIPQGVSMKSALLRSSLSLVAIVTLAFVGCDDAAKTKSSTPPPAAATPVVTPPKEGEAKTPASAPISNAAQDSARKK